LLIWLDPKIKEVYKKLSGIDAGLPVIKGLAVLQGTYS
jgi:hypothetical protein